MYRVLVVDDEPLVRASLRALVDWHEHGFATPIDAANGAEALQIVRDEQPDVVLLDMVMPRLGGIEFLRNRAAAAHEPPIVVVLSAHDEFSLVRDAFRLGAYDYLLKADMTAGGVSETLRRVRTVLDQAQRSSQREIGDEDRIRRQLLHDLLHSDAPDGIAQLLATMGCAIEFPLVPCEFHIDEASAPDGESERTQRKRATLVEYANSALTATVRGVLVERGSRTLVFLAFDSATARQQRNLTAVCRHVVELVESAFDISMSYAVGTVCGEPADIARAVAALQLDFVTESRVVRRAKVVIHARYADPNLNLADVSHHVEVSRTHLSAQFSRECNVGFRDYLTSVRIEQACRLIEGTGLRVQDISEAVGYRSAEHFSRTFKRVTGYSPTHYPGRNENS